MELMAEDGSDTRFAQTGDLGQIGRPARTERIRLAIEEWKVARGPAATDEPGRTHFDADRPPPAEQPHPEFDPTPPQ